MFILISYSLVFIKEIYTNGYISSALDVISISAIFCSVFVIISKNPIISVLFLIGLFASISSYLIILGLSFIGLSYLIVYIGAVSILFLFILMLINIRVSELQSNTSNSIVLAILIGIVFWSCIFQILPYDIRILNSYNYNNDIKNNVMFKDSLRDNIKYIYNNDVFFVTSKIWDGNLSESTHITSIGNVMYTNYNIWLTIATFILLLAMIGAIVITIKPKN